MPELPPVRRIVTAHNESGVAIVKSDKQFISEPMSAFPGAKSRTLWVTDNVPAKDNNDETDGATRPITGDFGVVSRGGTYCGITELAPGVVTSWHRTSSVDHNILLNGRLILMMEDGTEYLLENSGDIVIQRGTLHAWRNPGPDVVRYVSVLVDAEPAAVDGRPLLSENRKASL